VDGNCVRATIGGRTQRMCAGREFDQLPQLFKQLTGKPLTAAQRQALLDLSSATNLNTGIVTTQVGGKWFVNPIQTLMDGTNTLLEKFKNNDLLELIGLFKEMSRAAAFGVAGGSGGGGMPVCPGPKPC